jgi:hypothetical protein
MHRPRPEFHQGKRKFNGNDEDGYDLDVSMYERLRYVHVDVHGDDDDLRQDGLHDARDGVHASGLRGHVPDDHGHDDARLLHVRQDEHDVRRNVHGMLQHVHDHGRYGRNEALRGNVQALRRVVQHDVQDVHGRLATPQSGIFPFCSTTRKGAGVAAPFHQLAGVLLTWFAP